MLFSVLQEEDELNLEAFNHEAVNVTFAVATVAFGTSSYSPAVTLQVEAFGKVIGTFTYSP